jgi:hypothetical protein
VRTVAAGVIVDPNISHPLPFAGLSYVDFDLAGTGAQLSAFAGGTFGQLAFSVPSLKGSRWQLSGRAFAIASAFNDRVFVNGLEQYADNIRQRPADAAAWLTRALSPRIGVRAGYELTYTHFSRGESTDGAFVVPAHQVAHAALVELDWQRQGWSGAISWRPAVRTGWRRWGRIEPESYDPRQARFQRFGASAVRSFVVLPSLAGRVEASWMDGRRLDRFSRYAFGTFDNRLRGYPSALIRYDRGGAVRTAAAWAPGSRMRIDGFADAAAVRDPGFGRGFRTYAGIGAAIEVPAPFRTLVAVEWGFGFRGVTADGGTGTHVVRVNAYRVF